jgi:hypothetical protein
MPISKKQTIDQITNALSSMDELREHLSLILSSIHETSAMSTSNSSNRKVITNNGAVSTSSINEASKALSSLPKKTSKVKARSGVEGVHAHPKGGWIGRVTIGGKSIYVGYFPTIAEAKEAIEIRRALHAAGINL